MPRQKWNSSADLTTVQLPSFSKFSLIGVNGSFSLPKFFSTKANVEKLFIYESNLHEVDLFPVLENLLLSQAHTRKIVIDADLQYVIHTLAVVDNELRNLPRRINQLVRLKSLDLANNQLEKINLTELSGLRELETIDLSANYIQELEIRTIDLPNLLKLDLSHNELKSIPMKTGRLRSLEQLILSHNKLEYVEMSRFNGLSKLKVLDLRFNDLQLGTLTQVYLPALEVLRLESCRLQQLELLGMETPKLNKLHVEDNKLEYLESYFNDSYQGPELELYGDRNPWSCSWLQDKHPRVKFVVQQDRQTCRRFVKNVCCVGSDYHSERRADRRLLVVKQQNWQIHRTLEKQQEDLRRIEDNVGMLGKQIAKIDRTFGEVKDLVKLMSAKLNADEL
ncbi:leucine-rich repeat-containing protein 15-like [Ochlerotatus camptorhynchus]|uniref:leucine-rich repeat-containing protein 15-like n=1 Tax=Ochlerotatus camptorhynchus TaxID=644619 RepID=UPI0031DA9D25